MAVRVNAEKCHGCPQAKEPLCVFICPGDLFYQDAARQIKLRDSRDCWDCAACVKSCPREAIEMYLPVQLGGQGAILTARTKGKKVIWQCTRPGGKKEIFEIQVKN